jgi:hypothetical protein
VPSTGRHTRSAAWPVPKLAHRSARRPACCPQPDSRPTGHPAPGSTPARRSCDRCLQLGALKTRIVGWAKCPGWAWLTTGCPGGTIVADMATDKTTAEIMGGCSDKFGASGQQSSRGMQDFWPRECSSQQCAAPLFHRPIQLTPLARTQLVVHKWFPRIDLRSYHSSFKILQDRWKHLRQPRWLAMLQRPPAISLRERRQAECITSTESLAKQGRSCGATSSWLSHFDDAMDIA